MSMTFKPVPVLMMAALLAGCSSKEIKKSQQAPVKVSIFKAGNNDMPQQLSYSGTIEPDNTADIGFAVHGVVSNIAVEEGQMVKQGQLLASIDATEYSNALAIANASLDQAEDMYKRLHELYQKGSLPEKDYIDIRTKLAQAKANKQINAKRIADSHLYAPMSGIITARKIERGSAAAPGVPAFTIVKTDMVYAKAAIPESEVGAIKHGSNATVYIPTLQENIDGKITIINPQADITSRTYNIKIKLANNNGQLLPGMLTNIRINTGKNISAITVPATAVVRDADDITYVFVANEQQKAVRKRITVGALTGTNEVVVTTGLNGGEKVITTGLSNIKEGTAISL
ncbi:efflux RND transporter periplasmic adaptor subunit [Chitinophaga nivalis]|uniref:Efflux RND transporter periplasmic adaptor subunit n=1 Tax=Chitinophaga nivalis TaxID=2991709 RepID=A0ABT3IQQ0_9BACT|nr:efflux RND transporter periplasmic adaptor subunit [Chitinophaga nivalis]MCW3464225.1 efflux RND transporter periplasmic adaptor subunit [Chitinophaga nivalis]MCW3486085.1 efflux RND transporter periplasmic adaptor subunit [Chitinophaga nivalis]